MCVAALLHYAHRVKPPFRSGFSERASATPTKPIPINSKRIFRAIGDRHNRDLGLLVQCAPVTDRHVEAGREIVIRA
jgi:hypothetical protein